MPFAKTAPEVPLDWALPFPDGVELEPDRGCDDLLEFEGRFFLRGVLDIPLCDARGFFGWGVWAEVSQPVFERYRALTATVAWSEPPQSGILANVLPPYPGSFRAKVTIFFRESTRRPHFQLLPDDRSALAAEQRWGIDRQRQRDLCEFFGTSGRHSTFLRTAECKPQLTPHRRREAMRMTAS